MRGQPCVHTKIPFNSTIDRLKRILEHLNVQLCHAFNSTIDRLKLTKTSDYNLQLTSFNSTIDRLKPSMKQDVVVVKKTFQFYHRSIETGTVAQDLHKRNLSILP